MPTLFLIGTPLDEAHPLSPEAVQVLSQASVIVGESRKVVDRYLKGHTVPAERFFLDPFRKEEWQALTQAIEALKEDASVCLLSDVGMPILFDPGKEVLEFCQKKKFAIKTVPSATSWATACAVSGFAPPFFLHGFLERDAAQKAQELSRLKRTDAHLVLMETPYRYRGFLKLLQETFGKPAQVFLAWNIAQKEEHYFWGTLDELEKWSMRLQLEKGEFVLILKRRIPSKGVH